MHGNKGVSVWSVVAVVAICAGTVWLLLPVLLSQPVAKASYCQSSMRLIGLAISSYMSDWGEFPTNRYKGQLSAHVPLTADNANDRVFDYGTNWVEAIYSYVEKVGNPGDNATHWVCENAKTEKTGKNACVTYAINMNLLERPAAVIKDPRRTMLLRELDRQFDSVCRPINICKDAKTRPIGAFLTHSDPQLPQGTPIKYKLHGNRYSNILFTDGHVECISTSLMPPDDKLYWDIQTKQWWNSGEADKKQIAITP